jgi:hypothetical protein
MGFAPSLNLAPTAGYILGPNDRLSIRIYGLQEQTMNVTVANNGTVVVPYGGKITLSGLTLSEAERALSNQLKKYGFASLGTGESHLKIQTIGCLLFAFFGNRVSCFVCGRWSWAESQLSQYPCDSQWQNHTGD